MSNYNFEVTVGRPKLKDYKVLSDGMLLFHSQNGHQRISEEINIFLKDDKKSVYGGVIVTVLWNGLEINSLWVKESLRGQGWGKKLLLAAEKEGKVRGCTVAYTNTFTWQAPEFYKKLGYKPYGKLDNFPPGSTLTYFSKKL
jgi:ribosomal protein S18 acetylase RimI-like enzyme